MKLNWKIIKVAVAVAVIVGTLFWATDSVRSRSYQGTQLTFVVGHGPVTVTNTAIQPVSVQLVGEGARSFSIASPTKGLSGSSTRQGTGSSMTQLLAFELPFGVSEFTVRRGATAATGVTFMASSFTGLAVIAQPLNPDETRITLVLAALVVLGALFYLSSMTGHAWIQILRGKVGSAPATKHVTTIQSDGEPERPMKAYGDNRMDLSH